MKNSYRLLLILFTFVFSGYAQDDKGTKITIFKPEDATPTQPAAPQVTSLNCIKWHYSLLGRGIFLMDYERPISPKFSIEVGAGLTFRDFIFEAFRSDYFELGSDDFKFGYALEAGARFYPKEADEFTGFYVSPMVSYRKYNVPQIVSSGSQSSSSTFSPGYNFTDLQFKIGFCYESLWDFDLLGEVYFGVGVRYAKVSYYGVQYNSMTGVGVYTPMEKKLQLPQLMAGLKFGLPF